MQRQLAAFVVKLLEAVEAVAAITHHLAGLAHIAKLLGKLQEIQFPVAPEVLERHEVEQQLRDAQLELDLQLHDLKTEFIHREGKLRQAYLDRASEIAS